MAEEKLGSSVIYLNRSTKTSIILTLHNGSGYEEYVNVLWSNRVLRAGITVKSALKLKAGLFSHGTGSLTEICYIF